MRPADDHNGAMVPTPLLTEEAVEAFLDGRPDPRWENDPALAALAADVAVAVSGPPPPVGPELARLFAQSRAVAGPPAGRAITGPSAVPITGPAPGTAAGPVAGATAAPVAVGGPAATGTWKLPPSWADLSTEPSSGPRSTAYGPPSTSPEATVVRPAWGRRRLAAAVAGSVAAVVVALPVAAATNVLPAPARDAIARAVEAVTPFELPGGRDREPAGNPGGTPPATAPAGGGAAEISGPLTGPPAGAGDAAQSGLDIARQTPAGPNVPAQPGPPDGLPGPPGVDPGPPQGVPGPPSSLPGPPAGGPGGPPASLPGPPAGTAGATEGGQGGPPAGPPGPGAGATGGPAAGDAPMGPEAGAVPSGLTGPSGSGAGPGAAGPGPAASGPTLAGPPALAPAPGPSWGAP
ncbi:MAG: hypothetical protein AB1673_15205 [Actinomycetota bacterium]